MSTENLINMNERGAVVAVVEDHQLLGEALEVALRAEGCDVHRPPVANLAEIAASVLAAHPDVALLDLDLGAAGNGTELVARLVDGGIGVLIVSGTTEEAAIGACLELGAAGWLPKSAGFEALLGTVLSLAEGRTVLPEPERQRLMRATREDRRSRRAALEPFNKLSGREAEVLGDLIDGLSAERIATKSFVSVTTVRSQVRAVFLKLGVRSQLEAVAMATRAGWRPPTAGSRS